MRFLYVLMLHTLMSPAVSGVVCAQQQYRVLFLGNSVFYFKGGIYQSFEGFCASQGLDYQAFSQRNAPQYQHGIDFLEFGRIPYTLPEVAADSGIHELIERGRFDYVVMEARREGYLLPEWVERPGGYRTGTNIPYEKNVAALQSLHRTIVRSGANTVLYMHPGLRDKPEWRHAVAQLYERLKSDLENTEIGGRTHPVLLVPASLLWDDALNRYGADTWYADYMHGKKMARYASGCMVYTYITGKDPRSSTFNALPKSWKEAPGTGMQFLDPEDAIWLKNQVWLYYSTRP